MLFQKKGWIILSILFLFGSNSIAQNVVQNFSNIGTIDWSNRVLRTTGIGALNSNVPESARRAEAIETAKRAALRNLNEIIRRMSITSEITGENLMAGNSQVHEKIDAMTREYIITDVRYLSTDDVEVDVGMPFTGELADLLLPKKFGGGQLLQLTQPLCPLCGQPWPEDKPIPEDAKLIMPGGAAPHGGLAPFTGLIIEARGLNLQPALAPRILDNENHEIYSQLFGNRSTAVEMGLVSYAKNLDQAKKDERVKTNPMIIKAIGCTNQKIDVIITKSDARLIHGVAAGTSILERCRVIFLID